MIFMFKAKRTNEVAPGSILVHVFAGNQPSRLGNAGTLRFRPREWATFQRILDHASDFVEIIIREES